MVVGTKMAIQHVPSKGRISIKKIQKFTVRKRHSVIKIIYGVFLVLVALTMILTNPLELVTRWFLEVTEGSFVFRMWETPTYKLYTEVWTYNYTNVPEYLRGDDKVLKLQEIGPFLFQEHRTNRNLTIDHLRGVMSMRPNTTLEFLRNQSIGDTKEIYVQVPNIALLAISTIIADKLGYLANAGAYYSINTLGSKLFRNLTVEELFWGYDDPIVSIANGLLPGWIDFNKIGIMDRFYAQKKQTTEVVLGDETKKFSINTWDGLAGIKEQGFTDLNSSIPCNRIQGTFEGLMLPPNVPKDKVISIYRRQACRIYPFSFKEETNEKYGFNYYRFAMEQTALSNKSKYACKCKERCLPDGFVDVSKCYYGFPITLSKPHFLDSDPKQQSFYEGMHPDPAKHLSVLEVEPTIGVPISLSSKIQVNVAVRMSPGNPITRPFKDKIVPLLWVSLYCKEPPPEILMIMKLRFIIAPPLIITIEILLFIIGVILGVQGAYRIWRPTYKLIESEEDKKVNFNNNKRMSNVIDNTGFRDDDELARDAVRLLAIHEDDCDLSGLVVTET